jgi:hypothetical protein
VLCLAADGGLRHEGVPHVIDLATSRATAKCEAQLVVPDCDPAVACTEMN